MVRRPAGFVFIVFHRIVTRRLGHLLSRIKRFDLEAAATSGLPNIPTAVGKYPNEIGEIGIALCDIQGDLLDTHRSVREREHQLSLVTDNLPGSVIYVGVYQCYKFVNKSIEKWLARPVQEIVGRPVREILGKSLTCNSVAI